MELTQALSESDSMRSNKTKEKKERERDYLSCQGIIYSLYTVHGRGVEV